jgi:hypothetical protein
VVDAFEPEVVSGVAVFQARISEPSNDRDGHFTKNKVEPNAPIKI